MTHFILRLAVVVTPLVLFAQQPSTTATVSSKGVSTQVSDASFAELAKTRTVGWLTVERGGASVEYQTDKIARISVVKPEPAGTNCRLTITLTDGTAVEGVKTEATEAHRTWFVGKTRDGGAFSVLLCDAKEIAFQRSKP